MTFFEKFSGGTAKTVWALSLGQTIGAAYANSEDDGAAGFGPAWDARMSDAPDQAWMPTTAGQITAEPLTPEPVNLSGLNMSLPSLDYDDGSNGAGDTSTYGLGDNGQSPNLIQAAATGAGAPSVNPQNLPDLPNNPGMKRIPALAAAFH